MTKGVLGICVLCSYNVEERWLVEVNFRAPKRVQCSVSKSLNYRTLLGEAMKNLLHETEFAES